jgi:predicted N-acetyltransferase YhbS
MSDRVLRGLRESDLEAVDPVLRAAFGIERSFVPRLRRYLAIEPDGWFVGEQGGSVVGTVGVVRYDGFAYLGLMAVAPGQQQRGLGRWLLEHALAWLEQRGIGCAVLDATEAGAPLYTRLGFVDAGVTIEMARRGGSEAPLVARATDVAIARSGEAPEDADALRALDHTLFGAERAALWTRLAAEANPPVPTLLARAAGRAVGYLTLQPGLFGPWAATDPRVAESLLVRALAEVPADASLRVQVPGGNAAALALLGAAGFVARRTLRHMRWGELARAPAWSQVYGKGSYCLG